jgi:hypothetical protein
VSGTSALHKTKELYIKSMWCTRSEPLTDEEHRLMLNEDTFNREYDSQPAPNRSDSPDEDASGSLIDRFYWEEWQQGYDDGFSVANDLPRPYFEVGSQPYEEGYEEGCGTAPDTDSYQGDSDHDDGDFYWDYECDQFKCY